MPLIFRISLDEEVVTTTPSVGLDEGEGYASAALQTVVGFIASAAVAASSLAAQLPVSSRNQPDEVPTTVVQVVDEDYPASIAAPWKSAKAPIAFTADDEVTILTVDDSDFIALHQQVQPKAVSVFSADDEIATTVTTVVEEDGQFSFIVWRQRIAQPFAADDEVQLIGIDEEPAAKLVVQKQIQIVRPVTADDEIVPQPAGAVIEDEGWSVTLPAPIVYKQLWLFDPSEVSGTLGTVPPEEDFWAVNKGQPYPPPTIVKTDDDVFVPFVPPPTLAEEDLWWVNRPWVVKNPVVAITDDDVISLPITFQGSPDEDYPLPVIQPFPRIVYHQPITADDEIVNPLHAEDEGYRPPMPWKIPPRQAFRYDDEIVKPLRVDESDWLPPAPWKVRRTPFIIHRLEWEQSDLELPAEIVTTDDPCFRQYKADYDTATDVEVDSSIIRRPDTISLPYTTAFTLGSNVIGDGSGGVLQRAWRIRDQLSVAGISPVTRGLIGWIEARLMSAVDGQELTVLTDMSGHGHHMTQYDSGESKLVYHAANYPYLQTAVPNFNVGMYRWLFDVSGLTDAEWTVCAVSSVPFFHNSNALGTFGVPAADYYGGPLIGAVTGGKPSFAFGTAPVSGFAATVDTPYRVILAHDDDGLTALYHNGVLQAEVASFSTPGFTEMEINRGNGFGKHWLYLFYNVKLTPAEAAQNDKYMRIATGQGV